MAGAARFGADSRRTGAAAAMGGRAGDSGADRAGAGTLGSVRARDGTMTGHEEGTAATGSEPGQPARMYDYYLGGAHNFAVDRAAADKVLAMLPETRTFARDIVAFLQRVVRYLVQDAGITQFLDRGSGHSDGRQRA